MDEFNMREQFTTRINDILHTVSVSVHGIESAMQSLRLSLLTINSTLELMEAELMMAQEEVDDEGMMMFGDDEGDLQ